MANTAVLTVRMSPELKAEIEKLAEQDERSVNNWITRVLKERIQEEKQKKK